MNDPRAFQQADFMGYYKYVLQQANLAAFKEVSESIIIFGSSVIALLTLVRTYGHRKKGS
jgi:hypothetical protein